MTPHHSRSAETEPSVKIVIIDDNAGSLELLSTALAREGLQELGELAAHGVRGGQGGFRCISFRRHRCLHGFFGLRPARERKKTNSAL